ncbi:MAG: alpha-L-fucosidase [Planctomycetota bacterium]|jgi:alpha-L-fucosidase
MNSLFRGSVLGIAVIFLAGIVLPGLAERMEAAEPEPTEAEAAETQPAEPEETEEQKGHRTDWMYQAKWGVMFHYNSTYFKMDEDWDKTVNEFDVEGLAKQLNELGAGYFLITAVHGNSQPIAPNSVFEKKRPGACPKRDLIMDLADALAEYDIELMLYCGSGISQGDDSAKFMAEFIEEYSKRYGDKVKGWWLDSSNEARKDLQKLLADACRAGNPDSLVAFSNRPKIPRRNSPYEDYTSGNTHAPGQIRCRGRWLDGLQWHMLGRLAYNWGGWCRRQGLWKSLPHFVGWTKQFVGAGGVVTWDVPYETSGLIREEFFPHLKAIGEGVATIKRPGEEQEEQEQDEEQEVEKEEESE